MDLQSAAVLMMRCVVAVVLGGALGWNREARNKPAGLRTHMLVALGSATFVAASLGMVDRMAGGPTTIRIDPSRVVEGIIGGIGFLGAGSIIRQQGGVHGITTAATIWVVGAIGVVCGIGMYAMAVSTTVLALVILWFFGRLEGHDLEQSEGQDEAESQHRGEVL